MPQKPRAGWGALALLAVVLSGVLAGNSAPAEARGHHRTSGHGHPSTGHPSAYGRVAARHFFRRAHVRMDTGPTDPVKDAALIADGETGRVLYARNADAERHPASLTKMMTLYLLFEALKHGDVSMQTMIPISQHAAEQRPTNLHLYAGDAIPVDTAIKAIVVRSANDVAVAIGEMLGGTEGHFAELMTAKARALGMRNTFYHNASGLPDNLQITTASDLLILARHLAYDFPQYFPYFSTPAFDFRGKTYLTHDNLIGRYDGADGIKTGFTGASGFNLVSSVVRNGAHVIGVVMGGVSAHRRDLEMVRLLDDAFARIGSNPMLVAHNGVPWRALAWNAPPRAIASNAPAGSDDEDAAETRTGDSDDSNVAAAPAPPVQTPTVALPRVGALSPPPATIIPAPAQTAPLPAVPPAPSRLVAMNPPAPPPSVTPPQLMRMVHAPRPTPKPQEDVRVATAVMAGGKPQSAAISAMLLMRPRAKPSVEIGEGDIGDADPTKSGPRNWTIQIGAFADMKLAKDTLSAYVQKSTDVLSKASRFVVPFTAVDGHTLYRARFGPFEERQARDVCAKLNQRGQTCFTVTASSQ